MNNKIKNLTPAEEGELAAKKECQTNFKTAHETRCEIKKDFFRASGFAKEIINIYKSIESDNLPGGYNNNINNINPEKIEYIIDQLDNKIGLVTEYLRDLKKF